jgi:hypothetical protein
MVLASTLPEAILTVKFCPDFFGSFTLASSLPFMSGQLEIVRNNSAAGPAMSSG